MLYLVRNNEHESRISEQEQNWILHNNFRRSTQRNLFYLIYTYSNISVIMKLIVV